MDEYAQDNNPKNAQPQGEAESKNEVIEIQTKTSIFRYFLGVMIVFGACFIISIFVFQIVFIQIGVVGVSMQPTINAQATGPKAEEHTDTVFCYRTTDLKYKDIVIINETKVTNERIIKRVIATPGQEIKFKYVRTRVDAPTRSYIVYDVYVNDVKLDEPYINSEEPVFQIGSTANNPNYSFYNTLVSALTTNGEFSMVLGKDQYFVMGDNRNHSTDSRYFGPITRDEIVGKVVLQVKYGQTLFGALIRAIF